MEMWNTFTAQKMRLSPTFTNPLHRQRLAYAYVLYLCAYAIAQLVGHDGEGGFCAVKVGHDSK